MRCNEEIYHQMQSKRSISSEVKIIMPLLRYKITLNELQRKYFTSSQQQRKYYFHVNLLQATGFDTWSYSIFFLSFVKSIIL